MNVDFPNFLRMLLHQTPALLLYTVGTILCIVFWRRTPLACGLALGGLLTLLFASLSWPIFMHYTMQTRSLPNFSTLMTVGQIANVILHSVGFSLVLAAVFVGRPKPQSSV